jgi:hypothetical protein
MQLLVRETFANRSLEWIGDSLSNLTKLDISNCHEVSTVAPLIINRRRSVVVDGVGMKKDNERKRGLKKQERKEEKEREKEEKREKKREKEEEKEEKKRKKRMFIKRRTEKKRDNKESGHGNVGKTEGAERPLSDDSTDMDTVVERETRLSVSGGAAVDDREGEKDSIGSRKDKPREVKAKDKEREKETVAMLEEALTPSFGCPKLVDLNIFACNKLTGKGEEIARVAKSRYTIPPFLVISALCCVMLRCVVWCDVSQRRPLMITRLRLCEQVAAAVDIAVPD